MHARRFHLGIFENPTREKNIRCMQDIFRNNWERHKGIFFLDAYTAVSLRNNSKRLKVKKY
jgi:hypothetical protein